MVLERYSHSIFLILVVILYLLSVALSQLYNVENILSTLKYVVEYYKECIQILYCILDK